MKTINGNALGCYKSPKDKRDFIVKSFFDPALTIPEEYDLTPLMTPVKSQGNEGACTGFAGVACKEYFDSIEYKKVMNLSERFLYEYAKQLSGHSEGSTIRATITIMKKMGTCEEKYWPYIPNDPDEPSPLATKNAEKYRIKTYAKVLNIDDLKRALIQFGPLIAGIYVYKSIRKTGKDGVVPTPNYLWPSNWRPIGGHAICVVGYSDKKKLVKFKNSWGESWGDKGYGYLSYEYIRNSMIDCYSMVDITVPDYYTIRTVNDLAPSERAIAVWV